jgi:hypothetical protein
MSGPQAEACLCVVLLAGRLKNPLFWGVLFRRRRIPQDKSPPTDLPRLR